MEPYVRERTGKFPLSSLAKETSKGVGIAGASVPSRASLGLKALYAAVNANRRKRARGAFGGESTFLSKEDVGRERGHDRIVRPNRWSGHREARTRSDHVKGGSGCGMMAARVSAESFAAMPLMGHRYRYVSTIGTGRFSDVVRAEDTFRPGRSVAVKVMNLDCGAIGIREVRLMRFLSSVPHSEFRPVVRLVDALTYRGHYCLVMALFDGSLTHVGVGGYATHRKGGRAPVVTGQGQALPDTGTLGRPNPSRLEHGIRNKEGSRRRSGISAGSNNGQGARGRGGAGSVERSMPHSSCRAHVCSGEVREDRGSAGSPPGAGCPTHVIRHVAFQLVSALLLLQNHGLIHADIRPENILLKIDGCREEIGHGVCLEDFMRGRAVATGTESLTVNLADFGNAIHKSEAYLYYRDFELQTLPYRAPEVLMGCPLGPPVDVWSVGVILLELLIGRPLFHTAGSRAALLQQTVCAFGPLPFRRFRVGHFFSEYFDQDHLFKADYSAFNSKVGCCSCCWIGHQVSPDEDASLQVNLPAPGVPCDGRCARRCRLLNLHNTESAPAPAVDGLGRPSSVGSTASSSFGVAHAHLTRLTRAASNVSLPPGSGHGVAATGTGGASEECRRGRKTQVYAPRPKRSSSTTSRIARQDPRLLSFLAQLLCYDPDERLTPLQALAHPFFGEQLPFPVLQPATTAVGDRPTQGPAVHSSRATAAIDTPTPACTSRMIELTATVLALHDKRRDEKVPDSEGTHASSAHSLPVACSGEEKESPSSCRTGSVMNVLQSRCEAVVSKTTRRPSGGQDKSLEPPDQAAASTAGLKAASRLNGGSCSGVPVPPCPAEGPELSVAVDPTAQLRRLAEMAEAMMFTNKTRDSQCEDCGDGGSGNGSDASDSATPPSPRRNDSMDAAFLAKLDHEESPADRGVPAVATARAGVEAQAMTARSQRRRNRFTSPATLATPEADLEKGRDVGATSVVTSTAMETAAMVETGGDTEAEGSGLRSWRTESVAMISTLPNASEKCSPIRGKPKQPQQGKKRSFSATLKRDAKRAIVAVQDNHITEEEEGMEEEEDSGRHEGRGAPSERPKRSRWSDTGDRKRAANSEKGEEPTPSRASSGRTTTPRRAAIAAEAALLRLREDDESSDGSLTL